MPHLSKLAKEYDGKVTFVAISDEEPTVVEKFLTQPSIVEGKTWGQAMAFTVATDPDKSVKNALHKAAGQRGIPSSFIVRNGEVEWIGHPMGIDKPLHAVVEGTWDRVAFRQQFDEQQAVAREMKRIQGEIREAGQAGNWDEVVSILDGVIDKFPKNTGLRLQKWNILLTQAHRDEAAYELGYQLLKQVWDQAGNLNQLAWTVVDDKRVRTRDLGFAMKAAVRANELTESKDAAILDTLARVHFEKGDLDEAIRWQRMAVENAKSDELGTQIREVLEKYEAKAKEGKKAKL